MLLEMIATNHLFDYLQTQGLEPEFVEEDSEITVCCPLCGDDRPRLYINSETGAWLCFHCHEEGSLHQFLLEVCNLSGPDAFELTHQWQADNDDEFYVERTKRKQAEVDAVLKLPPAYRPITDEAPEAFKRYLAKRGVGVQLAEARKIGYALQGRYANRVILPVEQDGFLYTFIARTILKTCPNCNFAINDCTCRPYKFPKVLTPFKKEGSKPSHAVYNYDAVAASHSRRLVIVEGAFDALRLPNEAVALMKSSVSGLQLTILAGLARQRDVYICLDGDEAGYKGAVKLAEQLAAETIQARVALLPDGSDPGSLTVEELEGFLSSARRFVL